MFVIGKRGKIVVDKQHEIVKSASSMGRRESRGVSSGAPFWRRRHPFGEFDSALLLMLR